MRLNPFSMRVDRMSSETLTMMNNEIRAAILKAKQGNPTLMKRAEQLEAEGDLINAYRCYRTVSEIGMFDEEMGTGDELTNRAGTKVWGLSERLYHMKMDEIDSHPFGELIVGENWITHVCCKLMRDAVAEGEIFVEDYKGEPEMMANTCFRHYRKGDEEYEFVLEDSYYSTDRCPFCGKEMKNEDAIQKEE